MRKPPDYNTLNIDYILSFIKITYIQEDIGDSGVQCLIKDIIRWSVHRSTVEFFVLPAIRSNIE